MIDIKQILKYTKNLKLLYVEDNKEAREAIQPVLKSFFDNIKVAYDGQEGLEKFNQANQKHQKFDLVLTDINMPNMNGLEMSDEICEINPRQIIVVLSAHEELDYLEKLMELGVDKFILKPLDIDELVETFYKTILRLNKEKNE